MTLPTTEELEHIYDDAWLCSPSGSRNQPALAAVRTAILDALITEAENTLPWQLVVPQNDYHTDISGDIADWLRSMKEGE